MSLIATAKNKAAKGSVAAAFKNEAGAIDLASIMVGIIVIGLIGGVIAATVFAVIPWAQDNAAKQQLDSVAAAQSAFIGLSTDTTKAASLGITANAGQAQFGTKAQLNTAALLPASAAVSVSVAGTGSGAHYAAVTKSASSKYFYITDNKTQATDAADLAAVKTAVGTSLSGFDTTVS